MVRSCVAFHMCWHLRMGLLRSKQLPKASLQVAKQTHEDGPPQEHLKYCVFHQQSRARARLVDSHAVYSDIQTSDMIWAFASFLDQFRCSNNLKGRWQCQAHLYAAVACDHKNIPKLKHASRTHFGTMTSPSPIHISPFIQCVVHPWTIQQICDQLCCYSSPTTGHRRSRCQCQRQQGHEFWKYSQNKTDRRWFLLTCFRAGRRF